MKKIIQEHNDRVYFKTHRTHLKTFIGGIVIGIIACNITSLANPLTDYLLNFLIK